jgi:hypothetical protein
LLIFSITTRDLQKTIKLRNQFARGTSVRVVRSLMLGAPSLKLEWKPLSTPRSSYGEGQSARLFCFRPWTESARKPSSKNSEGSAILELECVGLHCSVGVVYP